MSLIAFQATTPDINLTLIAPELIIGVAGVIVMMVDAFARRGQRWLTGGLSILALLGAGAASIWLGTGSTGVHSAFNGMIVLDQLRLSFTLIFVIVSILTVLIAAVWIDIEKLPAGEFHALLLFATCGMMLMAAAGDLVIVFLGLEILSIATYVMAGFRRTDVRSNESALKYFILGSFASAFLLYGIALVYGATATDTLPGTTNIAAIAGRLNHSLYPPLLLAGLAMLLVGFGFKIATAPFHVWTPDVYEGAPTPVTAFMAAGPKAAGFASFMRVFVFGFPIATAMASTGAFAIITLIGRSNDRHNEVDDYNGIGFLSPVLAFSLSLFLLSLLGMPLTAGFMGKVMVFTTAIRQGYSWLVVIGVLNTAISAYYYLRLIVVMFFRERNAPWDQPRIPVSIALALVITIASVFYLGIFPERIIRAFSLRPTTSLLIR